MDVVGRKGLMFLEEAWSDFLPHIMIAIASTTGARPGQRKMAWPRIGIRELPNLAHPINHAFCSVRNRPVPFR